jgi:hypothetical protein
MRSRYHSSKSARVVLESYSGLLARYANAPLQANACKTAGQMDQDPPLPFGPAHNIHQFRNFATLFGFVTRDDRMLDAVRNVIA